MNGEDGPLFLSPYFLIDADSEHSSLSGEPDTLNSCTAQLRIIRLVTLFRPVQFTPTSFCRPLFHRVREPLVASQIPSEEID